jgi:hypothetical protein
MSDHLDQENTADASAQVIEIEGGYAAERHIPMESDGHAADNDAVGNQDESTSTLFDRQRLKSLFQKPTQPNYEPVLTRQHDLPYKAILRNCARSYAEQGLYIFPCRPIDILDENGEIKYKAKTPLTRNGHKDASIDPARIAHWWSEFPNTGYPDALIGVRTGLISGF